LLSEGTSVEEISDEDELEELDPNSAGRRRGMAGKKAKKTPISTNPSACQIRNSNLSRTILISNSLFIVSFKTLIRFGTTFLRDGDYQDGLISLTSVSLTTNTAFDLFQRAEKSLQSQLPKGVVLENYEKTIVKTFTGDPFEKLGRCTASMCAIPIGTKKHMKKQTGHV